MCKGILPKTIVLKKSQRGDPNGKKQIPWPLLLLRDLDPPGYGHFERHAGHWRIKCVKCASGRVLTDKDPGVKWAQRAVKEAHDA